MQAQPGPELKSKENTLQKLEEMIKNFLLRLQEIGESELDDIAHEIRSDIDFYKALYSRDKEETTISTFSFLNVAPVSLVGRLQLRTT